MGEIKEFPASRIERIPVNPPFERLPTCAHDPGRSEFQCVRCPEIARLVDVFCVGEVHFERNLMFAAIDCIMSSGYKIVPVAQEVEAGA